MRRSYLQEFCEVILTFIKLIGYFLEYFGNNTINTYLFILYLCSAIQGMCCYLLILTLE